MKMMKKTLVFLLGFAMVLTLFTGTAFAEETQPDPSAAALVSEAETAAENGTEDITDPALPTETEDAVGTSYEEIATAEDVENVSEPQNQEETSADADTQKEEDAEEAEFATGTIEISGSVSVDPTFAGTDDNDELLMDYIDVSLGTSTEAAYSTMSVGRKLEGAELNAYTVLKSWVARVAKGEITNTIIDLTKEQLGLKDAYTKVDLNVTDLGSHGEISQEAQAAISKVVPSLVRVNAALLFDNPYDLYWYDKSTDGAATYAYSISYTYNTETTEIISINVPKMTFRFAVAEEYANTAVGKTDIESGGKTISNYYNLDQSKLSTVQTALTTIQEIVDANASKGAYEKLKAYKDKIDELVDYHETAMKDPNTPYGNPWQLIWVFDNNPETKVVCEGYSKAFQYLFDLSSGMSGIDCRIVTGPMDGGTGAGPHMWNIVTMADGKNYLVDVTNCDNGMIGYQDKLFLVGVNYDSTSSKYARTIDSRTITYQYDNDTSTSYTLEELALSSADYDPSGAPKYYTVTFVDENGAVLKAATAYPEGTKAADIAKPADPTKAADAQYTYTFKGWTPEIADVTGDATYTATYDKTVNQYTVTWKNEDGTVLKTEKVPYGTKAADIAKPADPTKAADAQYTYTFAGWTPEITDVTGDATYTAAYSSTVNQYTITWKNEDGTVLESEKYDYGATPEYKGETPKKADTQGKTYSFAGWEPTITVVKGDTEYIATFTEADKLYTVTFVDEDGETVLKKEQVPYGTKAADIAKPADPTKAASAQYTYTFAGWSPEIADVTEDATYTATYDKTVNQYTITWKNDDGTVLESEKYDYGVTPEYKGETPKKTDTQEKTFSFKGWSPEISAVTGDATYTATFTEADRLYTVTFLNDDGTVLKTEKVPYGTKAADIVKPADPTKAASAQYTYTFAGWSPEITDVTGDVTYTATYNTTVNQYTITWKNEDGTVLEREKYDDGATPEYKGETPKKTDTQGKTYSFTGWSPAITVVKGDTEYIATFTEADKLYTVTFVDEDGETVLKKEQVPYGTKAADIAKPADPTKAADAQYTYTFVGWSPEIADVTGDATYMATYDKTVNQYTVTWQNDDGTVLKTDKVAYGTKPSYTGTTPTKAADAQYTYTFAGWSPEIADVTGDATYTATYDKTVNQYTITWLNADDTVLKTEKVAYGSVPSYGGTPTYGPNGTSWTFEKWTPDINVVTGDATYKASYRDTTFDPPVPGSYTGLKQAKNGIWYYLQGGKFDFTYNGVVQNENGWWKVTNGIVDFNFNGFERNDNGWWYLENGKVHFNKNDVIYGNANNDPSKAGEAGWWLVRGSCVQNNTIVANNAYGWWYVKNGKVDFTYTGVANNENGWWAIINGGVNFGYYGFLSNEFGWWYLENGKVHFNKNDVIYGIANNDPSKAGEYGWWLVRGSCVQNNTIVANNAYGWWYVKNGKVDFTYTGVANNENGWWAIINGGVNFGYYGFLSNENGWWYLENGKVGFDKNDVIYGIANTDPSKAGEYGWWLVRGSCVQKSTTVAQNANGWWYVKDGKVDFTYNGVVNHANGWWAIINGALSAGFYGFLSNENGWWYLENGQVTFGKNDILFDKGNTDPSKAGEYGWWLIRGSRIVDQTTVAQNANGWWYVENGKVNFNYTGLGTNENGTWYIRNGGVDFNFTGEYDGIQIINGKAQI